LVFHQRNQRRDDNANPGADQRRYLIAKRFAAAGGHEHQGIATIDDMIDDRRLLTAEVAVAEYPLQNRPWAFPLCRRLGHAAAHPLPRVHGGQQSTAIQRPWVPVG
jgi:hypothetical protein